MTSEKHRDFINSLKTSIDNDHYTLFLTKNTGLGYNYIGHNLVVIIALRITHEDYDYRDNNYRIDIFNRDRIDYTNNGILVGNPTPNGIVKIDAREYHMLEQAILASYNRTTTTVYDIFKDKI